MSMSGWEALSDIHEWSGGPPGCSGVVGRPSRMSGSGLEALPDVSVWSGVHTRCLRLVGRPPRCLGVVGRFSWMSGSCRKAPRISGSGREALLDVREWSGGPPVCP